MTDTETIHALDAAYKPFPSFSEWSSRTAIDNVRWERYQSALKARAGMSEEVLKRARNIAKRAAALDTGAIEGLYEVDRGFTYSVAWETTAWEAAFAQKGEHVRSLFEAQLHAYDYVLDLATKAEPISEAAIRTLHEVVCQAQLTYRVVTTIGPQEQTLPRGQYKTLPNHVRTRKGTDHSYAPVDVTPAEMARLVGELRSPEFLAAHPVEQAAYAHYGLVVIHPFADGNGRVARALASAFTYRAISMPIVVLSEDRKPYLDSLEAADAGDYQQFVDFIMARSLDTIKLVDESVRSAVSATREQVTAALTNLYITRGGFTLDQVDSAGVRLVDAFMKAVNVAISSYSIPKVKLRPETLIIQGMQTHEPGYRVISDVHGGGHLIRVNGQSEPPAQASIYRDYVVLLPIDAAGDDDILLKAISPPDTFAARMDEVFPSMSGVLQIRLNMFAERIVAETLSGLNEAAERILRTGRP